MIRSFMIAVFSVLLIAAPCFASYVIDGDINDWGIDLSQAQVKGYLNTHNPQGGVDIDYVHEDNADDNDGWVKVGPGWSIGNSFDAEALYFDNDSENAYIALIQGMPDSGALANGRWLPGDIAIDADNDQDTGYKGYELGLVMRDHDTLLAGSLYSVSSWNNSYYYQHRAANPWNIEAVKGDGNAVEFVYSNNPVNGHYVTEASIPLAFLGLSAETGSSLRLHWAQQCGNDNLNLNADVNPVPEPGSMALLFCGFFISAASKWIKSIFRS